MTAHPETRPFFTAEWRHLLMLNSEPYLALPMSHRAETLDGKLVAGSVLEYSWLHRGRWNSVAGTVASEARPLPEGTEAEFITEHYWGYTARGRAGPANTRWSIHPGLSRL
ncbi:hypothetical protein BH23GEM9_BH23GEM9_29690 [soil metagenome]